MRLKLNGSTAMAAAILLLAGVPAAAQDNAIEAADDVASSEPSAIVVTATRSGTALENLPVSVSVVNEEDLREQLRQNRNILSALEFTVPGLSIQAPEDRSSCGSQIRGRTASFQINGVPVNEDLSAFHRQLRRTADHVISAGNDDKRRRYFSQLLEELEIYQEKLIIWQAPPQVTEPVERLVFMLHRYQNALTDS